MTTERTEEERHALGERLRLGRESARAARSATAEQMLASSMQNQTEITEEDIFSMQQRSDAAGEPAAPFAQRVAGQERATVTHQTSSKVTMYKPTPQGYRPRLIPSANIGLAVRSGWLAACPDCGRSNCMANGDQNDCPGRAPRLYRTCPIASCRKKFHDTLEIEGARDLNAALDPNEIPDDLASRSTPEARTWTELSAHLMAVHPKEAPRYGAVPVTHTTPVMQPIVGTMAGQR